VKFRKATNSDMDFIIETIIASEKSGTDILSWSAILGISERNVANLVRSVLEEEIEGQEWHLGHFWIMLDGDDQYAGALSAWIEGINGSPSGVLKAQAISWFEKEAWASAQHNLQIVQKLNIPRIPQALQLENIYIRNEFQGLGLGKLLIESALQYELEAESAIEMAEIQLMSNNTKAMRAYTKCGFLKRLEIAENDPKILHLLPGDKRISLMRLLTNGNS
jgi:GNAT superfamily N-acetyltransferase